MTSVLSIRSQVREFRAKSLVFAAFDRPLFLQVETYNASRHRLMQNILPS